MSLESHILARLHDFRQRKKGGHAFLRLLQWAGLSLTLTLLILTLEFLFWFSPSVRLFFVSAGLLCIGISFLIFLIRIGYCFYQKQKPSDVELACEIGDHIPEIGDRLANAIQLNRALADDGVSASLSKAAFEKAASEACQFDFKTALERRPVKPWFFLTVVMTLILLFSLISKKGILAAAFYRLCHPKQVFVKPCPYQYTLFPGDVDIASGDSLVLGLRWISDPADEIQLKIKEKERLQRHTLQDTVFLLESVQRSFDYAFVLEKHETPWHSVTVLPRPVVQKTGVKVVPPSYTGLPPVSMGQNDGHIEAVRGSRVFLEIESSKPLIQAVVQRKEGGSVTLNVREARADGRFTIFDDDTYIIKLLDTDSLMNIDPISYIIKTIPDRPPYVDILHPETQTDLDQSMIIPLSVKASDDFGLKKGRIGYHIVSTLYTDTAATDEFAELPGINGVKTVQLDTAWSVENIGLVPDDMLYYYVEACDNDVISGPKWTRSPVHRSRFPSMYEIINEASAARQTHESGLEALREKTRQVRDQLQSLSDDLKSGEEIGWQQEQMLDHIDETRKQIQDELETLKENMDSFVESLEKNDVLSLETLEKYDQLQTLFEEIATPEMHEAMEKMQALMDQLSHEAVTEAVDQMRLSEEALLESLDRSLDLLKRIQAEQQLDEAVKQMEQLSADQQALNERMEDEKTSHSQLADKEERLTEQMKALHEKMKDLQEKMAEMPNMPSDALKEMMARQNPEQLVEQMQQIQNALKSGQQQSASELGRHAQQHLKNLLEALQQLQMQMQRQSKKTMMDAFERLAFRLIQISENQEALNARIRENSVDVSETMKQQHLLMDQVKTSLVQVQQLGRETIFIQAALNQLLAQGHAAMSRVVSELQNRKSLNQVKEFQTEAMASVNRAVAVLMESMDQLSNSGSGSGMEQFFEQMQKMGQQQMALNRQIMDLMQKGQLSMEDQAMLRRMAARQRALGQQLEAMRQNLGSRGNHGKRLQELIEEIEEAAEALAKGQIDPHTLEKQQRILNRMLEAQQALKEQKTGRKRQAKSGKNIHRSSPESIEGNPSAFREKIRQELMDLNQKGFAPDYERLIRDYFERLLTEEEDE